MEAWSCMLYALGKGFDGDLWCVGCRELYCPVHVLPVFTFQLLNLRHWRKGPYYSKKVQLCQMLSQKHLKMEYPSRDPPITPQPIHLKDTDLDR